MPLVVKTGPDSYAEVADVVRLGYDFDGYHLYHAGVKYAPFEATEVERVTASSLGDSGHLPDGVFRTHSGRLYRCSVLKKENCDAKV